MPTKKVSAFEFDTPLSPLEGILKRLAQLEESQKRIEESLTDIEEVQSQIVGLLQTLATTQAVPDKTNIPARIVAFLELHPKGVVFSHIAKALGLDKFDIKFDLEELEDAGVVIREMRRSRAGGKPYFVFVLAPVE